jgi:hypothetical protein
MGAAQGGRGGGGGRGGAPAGGRGGRAGGGGRGAGGTGDARGGGGAGGGDQDQNPVAQTAPVTIQARLQTTNEMLGISFNPSPEQKRLMQVLPGEIQKNGDRVEKVMRDDLPALIKALKAVGVDTKQLNH